LPTIIELHKILTSDLKTAQKLKNSIKNSCYKSFIPFVLYNSILCYEEQNEVLCNAAGRLAAERSEADKPAKAHKTIFAPNNIYLLFFLQTFITNSLRHVKKPGRNFK
jgi:hypothetical protein